MRFRFGNGNIEFPVPDANICGILEPQDPAVRSYDTLVKESLLNPIGAERLRTLLRRNRPGDAVIIVSDRTRTITKYAEILELLISELIDAGLDERNIECLVALGTHRKHTDEEDRSLYKNLIQSIRFSFHDCHKDLVPIGKTSTDLEVLVSKRARCADFVIATGKIDFHYMAGFSGGRKAVLPGIASYESIRSNHCKLRREGVAQGIVAGNVIAREMHEAAELFGLDYLLNVVEAPDSKTSGVFCGDPKHAFERGLALFKEQRCVSVSGKADCAIVSAGGDPGDRTFYVGHKVLNNVVPVVKPGGTIILVAQCAQGVGNEAFLELLSNRTVDDLLCAPEDAIEIGGHRAYHTARLVHDYDVVVVSNNNEDIISKMNFTVVSDMDSALQRVKQRKGNSFTCYVIPDGHTVMPVIGNETC